MISFETVECHHLAVRSIENARGYPVLGGKVSYDRVGLMNAVRELQDSDAEFIGVDSTNLDRYKQSILKTLDNADDVTVSFYTNN